LAKPYLVCPTSSTSSHPRFKPVSTSRALWTKATPQRWLTTSVSCSTAPVQTSRAKPTSPSKRSGLVIRLPPLRQFSSWATRLQRRSPGLGQRNVLAALFGSAPGILRWMNCFRGASALRLCLRQGRAKTLQPPVRQVSLPVLSRPFLSLHLVLMKRPLTLRNLPKRMAQRSSNGSLRA
jgi:hypothetical protein